MLYNYKLDICAWCGIDMFRFGLVAGVCILAWMWETRMGNRHFFPFVLWPSFSVCVLHFVNMLYCLGRCNSLVHLSRKWGQGGCGVTSWEWGPSECRCWGNLNGWRGAFKEGGSARGYYKWDALCGNGKNMSGSIDKRTGHMSRHLKWHGFPHPPMP